MLTTVWLAQSAGVFDAVPTSVLNGVGVVGLVLVFFWLLATGRLVTRREVDKMEHDRDEWRAESRIKDAQIAEKDRQLEHMGEVGLTMTAVLGALQKLSRDDGANR